MPANVHNAQAITDRLSQQAQTDRLRITTHAHQEMVAEDIGLDDVVCAFRQATLVENYPEHKRGACCLVYGQNRNGRDLHIVCTTSLDLAIIITVYEPKPPKWESPFKRGKTK